MRRSLHALLVSALASLCSGEGAGECAVCHPVQTTAHAGSAHASALFRTVEHPLRDRFAGALRRGEFVYEISRGRLRANSGVETFEAPMEWAFGSGAQAVTFVSRVSRQWYVEFYPSYYRALGGFGPTPGQHALTPGSLKEAVGILYKTDDPATGILGCFECHSTGPVKTGADGELEPARTGVQCQACHGDTAHHVTSPSKGNVVSLRGASGRRVNEACGSCHRKPADAGQQTDWTYAWNVRHQPIYLNESRCFLQSRGKLTCITCHDPHKVLSREASVYNTKCRSCHTGVPEHGANCIDCHMPRVTPEPPLRFANHWIGVYGDASKLKPSR